MFIATVTVSPVTTTPSPLHYHHKNNQRPTRKQYRQLQEKKTKVSENIIKKKTKQENERFCALDVEGNNK